MARSLSPEAARHPQSRIPAYQLDVGDLPVVLTLSSRLSVSFRNHQVKNATWFCLLALLVLFSGLVFLFKRISKLERLRLDAADVRVKLLNETMQGIKVIKLMGMLTPIVFV